jgi:hypothetical protein
VQIPGPVHSWLAVQLSPFVQDPSLVHSGSIEQADPAVQFVAVEQTLASVQSLSPLAEQPEPVVQSAPDEHCRSPVQSELSVQVSPDVQALPTEH